MFIGRKVETALLKQISEDYVSHFAAVSGRRRIGKTFLIQETFGCRFTFQHTGLSGGSMKEQLYSFDASLKILEMTEESFDRVVGINLKGAKIIQRF